MAVAPDADVELRLRDSDRPLRKPPPVGVGVGASLVPSGERRNGSSVLPLSAPAGLLGLTPRPAFKFADEPLVLRRREAGTGTPTPPGTSPKLEGEGEPSTDVATGAAGFAALIGIGRVPRTAEPALLATLAGRARDAAKSRAGGDAVLARLARWERRTMAAEGEKGAVGEDGGGGGETIYFLSMGGGERASRERRGDAAALDKVVSRGDEP